MSDAFSDVEDEQAAGDVELSENVAEDLIRFSRGNIVGHEEEFLLMYFSVITGWGYDDDFHNNTIGQGPPGSGKSLTKNQVEKLIDDKDTYTKTDASSNAILDSREWDLALAAPMDEYDKIDSAIVEVLKSSNPEDGGYSKDRNVEDPDSPGGYSPTEVSAEANPWIVLYAPSSKKGGINNELADRALKLFFNNDKHTRRGIGRKEFGHDDIDIATEDYEYNYIYGTHSLGAALRQRLRELPTRATYEEDDDGNEFLASRTGDTLVSVPQWVWYACEPIFNIDEDHTNRVYGTVVNLIKSSALINAPNRPKTTTEVYVDKDSDETTTREAVIIQPQDVANVLSCLPALLSTTHQLTPLKRYLLDAIGETEPMTDTDGTTVSKVQHWLEDNDIPHPSRSTLKNRMDELAEDYYLNRYKSVAGPKGQADAYEKTAQGALQTPRTHSLQTHADRDGIDLTAEPDVDIDPSDPFADCTDPIRDQPFSKTVAAFDAEFAGEQVHADDDDALAQAMGSNDTSYGSSGGEQVSPVSKPEGKGSDQASLTDSTDGAIEDTGSDGYDAEIDVDPTVENPTQQWVLDALRDERGAMYAQAHTVIQKTGVVAPDDDPKTVDLSDTVADPDHELWQERPDLTDDRVISQEDALRELERTYVSLKEAGYVEEDETRAPPAMARLRVA